MYPTYKNLFSLTWEIVGSYMQDLTVSIQLYKASSIFSTYNKSCHNATMEETQALDSEGADHIVSS